MASSSHTGAGRSAASIALAIGAASGCSASNVSAVAQDAGLEDAGLADVGLADICAPYVSSADLAKPSVSFAQDVVPLLSYQCGLSPCHGHDNRIGSFPSNWGAPLVYLGCAGPECDNPAPGPDVYIALVGLSDAGPEAGPQPPVEIRSMPFVTPGSPAKSYLMHKLDGDLCTLQGCIPNNALVSGAEMGPPWCGGQEPYFAGPLDETSRDLVRRWIAQGARNN
jgi:hypothetical protein